MTILEQKTFTGRNILYCVREMWDDQDIPMLLTGAYYDPEKALNLVREGLVSLNGDTVDIVERIRVSTNIMTVESIDHSDELYMCAKEYHIVNDDDSAETFERETVRYSVQGPNSRIGSYVSADEAFRALGTLNIAMKDRGLSVVRIIRHYHSAITLKSIKKLTETELYKCCL